jgi:hypothetical protein
MKKLFIFFVFAIIMLTANNAQSITICEYYSDYGDPMGANTTFTCQPGGLYLSILYDSGMYNLDPGSYQITIDSLFSGNYTQISRFDVDSYPAQKWLACEYLFMEGNYRVTIKDPSANKLANTIVNLKLIENSGSSDVPDYGAILSSKFYSYATVEATSSIDTSTGEIPGPYNIFIIDQTDGGEIFFKVSEGGSPFDFEKFLIEITKADENGNYFEFDNREYILPESENDWAWFYLDFFDEGDYQISVYTSYKVLISKVEITVKYDDQ